MFSTEWVESMEKGSVPDRLLLLQQFNSAEEKRTEFGEMDKRGLWDIIFSLLSSSSSLVDNVFDPPSTTTTPDQLALTLNSLRILSRDKGSLEAYMTEERVGRVLIHAGLKTRFSSSMGGTVLSLINSVTGGGGSPPPPSVDALKVIFNMIFQSPILQVMFISEGLLQGLLANIRIFTNEFKKGMTPSTSTTTNTPEYIYFTTRILFLITALCQPEAPSKVIHLLGGLPILNDFLVLRVTGLEGEVRRDNMAHTHSPDIISETLKVMYNLVHNLNRKRGGGICVGGGLSLPTSDLDTEDLKEINRLVRIVKSILILQGSAELGEDYVNKVNELKHHSINLLVAVPTTSLSLLIPPLEGEEAGIIGIDTLGGGRGRDVSAVRSIVDYLDLQLEEVGSKPGGSVSGTQSSLAPVLCALHNLAEGEREARKYLKSRILPPLSRQDVTERPEVGVTTRNRLCALLTSPATTVTQLVANLLFILCKENVTKLVKYTGYGNAAGLIANKGLMMGGAAPPSGKYSDSEGDDTDDTDDYRQVQHLINQVEGRLQPDRPSPMDGMTDEQKEVEAMKLINAIDKMGRNQSLIQPCKIGPDGRPIPIQHVLELQEALENPVNPLLSREEEDSD